MGKVTGFLEIDRQTAKYQPASDRIRHWREFTLPMPDGEVARQAARCMDCGIPYCHGDTGCPVHNQIPDWNDLIYNEDWAEAVRNLHSTNNFPEFTGRICPAPCEEACTLNLEDAPVAIKTVEQAIADKGFELGLVKPQPPQVRTGRKVAVIGSGPAGLAAAQQLARAGHEVHVYERESKPGGLLRYGIPDFKMEKHLIDRRIAQLGAEGVVFHCGADVGSERFPVDRMRADHEAVLLAVGAEKPRDPGIPGQDLIGVHYAMPYLVQQNRRNGGEDIGSVGWPEAELWAAGKRVVVVGGGDTASDCIGTAFRQGAVDVTQLDIRPEPPEREDKLSVWPYWATKMRTSSSQAEGAKREFAAATLGFVGKNGRLTGVRCARVDERRRPVEGSEFILRADLAMIAIGFAGPFETLCRSFGIGTLTDRRGKVAVAADDRSYRTDQYGVWVAGDARRGQSLVVWAIREGRQAARAIDLALTGATSLPL